MRNRRPSAQTAAVLDQLVDGRWWHGYELSRRTGVASGTLYPMLMRLERRGYLESAWEEPRSGRPPRHTYRLTPEGARYAAATRRTVPGGTSPQTA